MNEHLQLKPQMKKLGRLFSFANAGKNDGKKSKDQGTSAACVDSFDA